jgi:hypothetical protein
VRAYFAIKASLQLNVCPHWPVRHPLTGLLIQLAFNLLILTVARCGPESAMCRNRFQPYRTGIKEAACTLCRGCRPFCFLCTEDGPLSPGQDSGNPKRLVLSLPQGCKPFYMQHCLWRFLPTSTSDERGILLSQHPHAKGAFEEAL